MSGEGNYPLALARRRTRELTNQCFEDGCPLARMANLRQHFIVLGGIHELYLAVLADPDTRLRCLDLAAADALPCFYIRPPAASAQKMPLRMQADQQRQFNAWALGQQLVEPQTRAFTTGW
jgi:hypothetical protein